MSPVFLVSAGSKMITSASVLARIVSIGTSSRPIEHGGSEEDSLRLRNLELDGTSCPLGQYA
jgi:hypothetical protein